MRAWTCLALICIAAPGWSQESRIQVTPSGVEKTETRDVGEFSQVELAAIGKVELTIGEEFRVQISADEQVLPYVTTEVAENRLRLSLKEGLSLTGKTEIRFAIQTPHLTQAVVSGAGDLVLDGDFGETLELVLSGAGSIRGRGRVAQVTGEIAGAGNLELSQLATAHAQIRISGTGNAQVQTSGNLEANISGVGNVDYQGATNVQARVDGIGHVRNRQKRESAARAVDRGTQPE